MGQQQEERKEPWVKVTIRNTGEVAVTGEGFNNQIELLTCLSAAMQAIQQQLVNQTRILVPGTRGPAGFPRGV